MFGWCSLPCLVHCLHIQASCNLLVILLLRVFLVVLAFALLGGCQPCANQDFFFAFVNDEHAINAPFILPWAIYATNTNAAFTWNTKTAKLDGFSAEQAGSDQSRIDLFGNQHKSVAMKVGTAKLKPIVYSKSWHCIMTRYHMFFSLYRLKYVNYEYDYYDWDYGYTIWQRPFRYCLVCPKMKKK